MMLTGPALSSLCLFFLSARTTNAWCANSFQKQKALLSSISSSRNQEVRTVMSTSSSTPKPKIALPPPILSDTPGTWAYDTMSRRVDSDILQRTYEDCESDLASPGFENELKRFQDLRSELQSAATTKLTYLPDLPADASAERQREYAEWKEMLSPFIDNDDTWLSAPWLVTEFYVYRRLMQALGYWDENSKGYKYDPFIKAKRDGLKSSPGSAEAMLEKIFTLPKTKEGVALASAFALWGNKMDLSIWPADVSNQDVDVFSGVLASASENLLHDDTLLLEDHCEKLRATGGGNVDIIVDNAGFELVTDLALAHHLVESGVAKCVTFQLKSHPTFVSDALEKDLLETVEYYANLDSAAFPNCQKAGDLWKTFLEKGQWKCNEDNFWVQPFAMWDMTEPLRTDMQQRCDLAFVKGDANYRRLLGDRLWDYSDPFQDVVGCYFPCPVCALRTLKAELGCGMDADQVERAKSLDDNWLVNGRFGVVHFGTGAGN
mmetsp:Transcript_28405/g.39920  ORF Transcript_28405/g.39920 Transcript_28405/m.39920 type:complete len:491 (-) Transcript_28405:368-1840(-)